MKKLFLFLISLLISVSINASELFINENVNAVIVNAPVRLYICQGDSTAIRFRGDVDVRKYVTCEVKDGILFIKGKTEDIDEVVRKKLVLYIMTPKGSELLINAGRGYSVVKLGGNHDKK